MSGHLLSRLWCLLVGHAERWWTVTEQGGGWVCPRCLHVELSRAVPTRPRSRVGV